MKYAVVSDIHANEQAWKAVLLDIRSMGVDKIISLGDIIGYGPNPLETLESLYETVDYFVLGNHDAALCGKIDAESFTGCARDMISWTRQRVGDAAVRFLAEQPLTLAGSEFRCAHGDFADPGRFCYVFEPDDAMPGWNAVSEPLLFIGHTHHPCIVALGKSRTPRMIDPQDFVLEEGKRFLVNVGSVGQPRDRDIRASYCIYDQDSGSIYWRKIPFDLDAYSEALRQAGIPKNTSPFLEFDPRATRPPLRELMLFNPPSEPARDTREVQYIDILRKKVRKWKTLFWIGIGLMVIASALAGWIWMRHQSRVLDTAGPGMSAVSAADFEPEINLLSFPAEPIPWGSAIPMWHVHLGNRYRQKVAWAPVDEERLGFELCSAGPQSEISVASPAVFASHGIRLSAQARMKKSPDFSGSVALVLVLVQQKEPGQNRDPDGLMPVSFETNRNFIVKEPNIPRKHGWFLAKQTVTLPARSHSVVFQIRGKFQGTAFIRDMRLERKK